VVVRDIGSRLGRLTGASTSQVLSSFSNVAAVIAVGRGAGPAALGRYTLAFGAYVIVLGFSRSLVSQPLLTLPARLRAGDPSVRASTTAAGWLGIGGGAVCVLVGAALRRPEFVAVGLLMAPLCIQDLLRFAFFQTDRPWRAALLDGIWLLATLAGFPIIVSQQSPVVAIAVWGAGATLAAVPGVLILKARIVKPPLALQWWKAEARHLAVGLAVASTVYAVGSQVGLWVISGMLGSGDLGRLKAAQTLLGPATVILVGFTMLTIPRMAQSAGRVSPRSILATSAAALTLVGGAAVALVWIGPLAARIVFGPDLVPQQGLFFPVAAEVVASTLAVGSTAFLMIKQRGATLAIARAIGMGTGIIALVAVSTSFGIVGAAWGLALGSLVFSLGTTAAVPSLLRHSKGPEG
jgi:O-antigen/teichoic acid export membrane protein